MTESGRERFEKWALAQGDSIARHCKNHSGKPCHKYLSTFTHWEWEAWQAAFEAGRGQRYEELRNKAEELLMKARDMDMSGMDSGWVRYAANQMLIAATPAPPDSGDANKK